MVSTIVMRMMFLTFLSISLNVPDNVAASTKTTNLDAVAAGKCVSPAVNVVMTMGSVSRVDSDLSVNKVVMFPAAAPDWVNDFGEALEGRLAKSIGDKVDSSLAVVRTDLLQEISASESRTNEQIGDLKDTVENVKDSNTALTKRLSDLEKEMSELKKAGRIDAPDAPPASKEDMDDYNRGYSEMRKSIGLAPFTKDDFRRIEKFLREKRIIDENTPRDDVQRDVFSSSLMDFWQNDMGMDDHTIERLDNDSVKVWVRQIPYKGAPPDAYTIFSLFKTEAGRLTCFKAAKMMNRMSRKHGVEYRRVMLHIIPQQEARHAVLNRLSYDLREYYETEKGYSVHTRIGFEKNTIVLQVRKDGEQFHKTVDIEKIFPEVDIPGIQYGVKEYADKQPKAYEFQGLKTPPGRARNNIPIRNPSLNPTREERERREERGRSPTRRSSFVGRRDEQTNRREESTNSNHVPIKKTGSGLANKGAEKAAANRTAANVFGDDLISLDNIYNAGPSGSGSIFSTGGNIITPDTSTSTDTSRDSEVVANKAFSQIDPLDKSYKGDPKIAAGYSFDVERNFGTKRKSPPKTSPNKETASEKPPPRKAGRPLGSKNSTTRSSKKLTQAEKDEKLAKTKDRKSNDLRKTVLAARSGGVSFAPDTDDDNSVSAEINDTFDLDD